MIENLKSARFLHNLLVLVCAAIIVFAVTPNRDSRYSVAEHELGEYLQLSPNDYVQYLYSLPKFKVDEQKEKNHIIEILRQNGYRVADQVSLIVPMWSDPMNIGGSLGNFCRLIQSKQTVILPHYLSESQGPRRPAATLVPEPSSKTDSADIVTAISLNSQPNSDLMSEIRSLGARPMEFPTTAYITLSVQRQGKEQLLSPLKVAYVSGASRTDNFGEDWLKSLPYGSHLIEGGRCLPNSLQMYPEIARMQPVDAMRYLASQRAAERADRKDDLEVSSLRIDLATVSWVAPIIIGLLLLFFLSHLRHLCSISRPDKVAKSFPWVVIFDDWLGRFIAYGTVALPILAEILLTYRMGFSPRMLRFLPPMIIGILSIWATVEIWRLRKVFGRRNLETRE